MSIKDVLKWTFILAVASVLLTAVAAPVVPWVGWRAGGLVGAAVLIALFGAVAHQCAVPFEQGRFRVLFASGMIAAALAGLGWTGAVIFGTNLSGAGGLLLLRIVGPATVWTLLCFVVAVLLLPPGSARATRILQRFALVFAAVAAAAGIVIFWWLPMPIDAPTRLIKALGVCGVLTIATGLPTAIITRLDQVLGRAARAAPRLPFEIECPRCGTRQACLTGGAACATCGLRVKVEVP